MGEKGCDVITLRGPRADPRYGDVFEMSGSRAMFVCLHPGTSKNTEREWAGVDLRASILRYWATLDGAGWMFVGNVNEVRR